MCLNVMSVPSFKSDLAALQSKFATVVCELEEMKSRPVLLGACKLCPMLRSELDEKNTLVKSLGKTKVVESSPPIDCSVCLGLISDLDNLTVQKANWRMRIPILGRFLVGFQLVSRSWA